MLTLVVIQLCPTLQWSHELSLPGSSVHGISQARTLEWVAIFFSKASSQPRDQICLSCIGRWVLYCWATWELPLLTLSASVQSLSRVRLFATPWTAACQASLSIRSQPKPMSIKSVMPSNHLILCRPLLLLPSIFPSIRVFSNELFISGGQSIGISASTSVPPMNTQDWSPLGWTGWISLHSKGLSRVFSNTTVQKHQFFGAQLSL